MERFLGLGGDFEDMKELVGREEYVITITFKGPARHATISHKSDPTKKNSKGVNEPGFPR
jgi:hypothetical protein